MSEQSFELEREAVHQQVGGWFDEFIKSAQYETLTEIQRNEAPGIVRFVTEYSHGYLGLAPKNWNGASLRECCVELMPQKMTAELAFFKAVAPVLAAFFNFVAEKGCLSQGRDLAITAAKLDKEIVAASQNKSNWGFAKSFMMAAEEAGIDVCDQQALHRFMLVYNARRLAQLSGPPPTRVPPMPALPAPAPPVHRSHPKTGRNDPCPCGSGKKFKKCCGR